MKRKVKPQKSFVFRLFLVKFRIDGINENFFFLSQIEEQKYLLTIANTTIYQIIEQIEFILKYSYTLYLSLLTLCVKLTHFYLTMRQKYTTCVSHIKDRFLLFIKIFIM